MSERESCKHFITKFGYQTSFSRVQLDALAVPTGPLQSDYDGYEAPQLELCKKTGRGTYRTLLRRGSKGLRGP